MKEILRQILFAALLVCVQVLILDNLQLRGGISTFVAFSVYFFYILLLPAGMPQVYLLLAAFGLGLAVDLFSDTLGVHAAACVFAGFVRTRTLRVFMGGREHNQQHLRPSIHSMGLIPFLYYTLVVSFCFHFALESLEVFTFHKFYATFARIILSTIISTTIMMVLLVLFGRAKMFK
jgi:rod shape-determining protein MreD